MLQPQGVRCNGALLPHLGAVASPEQALWQMYISDLQLGVMSLTMYSRVPLALFKKSTAQVLGRNRSLGFVKKTLEL